MKEETGWLLITVPVTETTRELIGSYLFTLGATGLVEHIDRLAAYFPLTTTHLQAKVVAFLYSLREKGFYVEPQKVAIEEIPDQDWNLEWKKNYHSLRIGQRLLIHPSWEPVPGDAADAVIQIDPEMAFGTGTHATTQLCLRLLEKYIRPGHWLLDIGTGTGILAIAAIKLGAEEAYAIDIDPIAVETADKNARANEVATQIHLAVATLAEFIPPEHRFDWLVANINRDQIIKQLALMNERFDYPLGIILSGILVEEEDMLTQALKRLNWEVSEICYQQEWLACVAKRENVSLR